MANKKTTKPQQVVDIVVETPVEEVKEVIKETPIYAIATTRVNVRQQPSIEAQAIMVLDKGEKVIAKSDKPVNGFIETEKGYIMKEYLKIEK